LAALLGCLDPLMVSYFICLIELKAYNIKALAYCQLMSHYVF
jgi:hypothetical protein